jgi:hypothetical protein
MKAVRALLVVLFVGACVDRSPTSVPTPPQGPQAQAGLIGSLLKPTGLLSCSDLPPASATQTVGSLGGVIRVGPHTLTIPGGALAAPTTITATLVTGRGVNAVHFEPAGLRFQRSASLTMSYKNCNLLGSLLPKRIAYTSDALAILEYLLSLDNLLAKRVTGQLVHFSDYAIAW